MNILFVCTGNTCRSPMAEGLLNKYAASDCNNIHSTSAGISVVPGSQVSNFSVEALKEYDVDISNHIPRQLDLDMIKSANLIITMAKSHKDFLVSLFPQYSDKIFTLAQYTLGDDISDPFGCDFEIYKECASEINDGVINLLERINPNE